MNKSEDLWQITKLVKQRYRRAEEETQKELAELCYQAMKVVREDPNVSNAKLFQVAEYEYLQHWNTSNRAISYSEKVLEAIKSNHFNYDSKPKINFAGNEENAPDMGYLYVACSDARPNQIKIGYTTMEPKKRMQKYKIRYGYPLKIKACAFVELPHKFEIELHRELTALRVSGFENQQSNEWFFCDENLVINGIERISLNHHLSIITKSWKK
jgi:hypothetical protein